jgi:hypothetical protein
MAACASGPCGRPARGGTTYGRYAGRPDVQPAIDADDPHRGERRSLPSARREARRSSSASPLRASCPAVQVTARSSLPSVRRRPCLRADRVGVCFHRSVPSLLDRPSDEALQLLRAIALGYDEAGGVWPCWQWVNQ